ncbi:MAG: family 16 glycosylhydrolase [Phycisphaeraceae bacterium]|nr:MAG: family 16 glycosylhydrolase [Phycisphaeraceae bacterium]
MILALLAGALAQPLPAAPTAPASAPTPTRWNLVWSDEFNGDRIDPATWRLEDAALVKNNERQYYSPQNAAVRDGLLILTADDTPRGGRAYTSALADTLGTYARAFGRFEARIQLPTTQGLWPAFWLLPADGRWPPEIDIMEALGHQPNTVYASTHWGTWPDKRHRTDRLDGPDFASGFHTFSCDWLPDRIDYAVDGRVFASHTEFVPDDPMYLILNLAVGGDWPKDPDHTTRFPQTMKIDWVRVHEPVEPHRAYLSVSTEGLGSITPSRWWSPVHAAEPITYTIEPEFGWTLAALTARRAAGDSPLPPELEGRIAPGANTRLHAVFVQDPDAPTLLSHGKPVTASSTQSDEFLPEFAVDASPTRRWSSRWEDNQWIQVDLGATHTVEAVRLHWEAAHPSRYSILASTDGVSWTSLASQRPGTPGKDLARLEPGAKARFVRVHADARATRWGVSLWEFEVFGRP